MTKLKKLCSAYIAVIALAVCALCAAFMDFSVYEPRAEEFVNTAQLTYLTELPYAVTSQSGSVAVSTDKNAVNGGKLSLGPASNTKVFNSGISFKTVSESAPVTLTVPVDAERGFGIFTTEYGVDRSSSGRARFVFNADGAKLAEAILGADDFQKMFDVAVNDVRKITVDVYGAAGTAVTFGGACFYESSPNAVSMLTENVVYGAWPAPLSRNANFYGNGLKIADKSYAYGFCVNSISRFDTVIDGDYEFFAADIGVDEGIASSAQSGSITVTAEVLDGSGRVLRSAKTPVLYDYMKPYRLAVSVSDGARIRFIVGDGGDGITNDMAVIGDPVLSKTIGGETVSLGGFPIKDYSIGHGTVGVNGTADGEALTYSVDGHSFSFESGLGLNFKPNGFTEYLKDPANVDNYSYVKYDVAGLGVKHIEGLAVMSSGGGAFAEVYADGAKILSAVEVTPTGSGGAPARIAASVPQNAGEIEIRIIAANNGETEGIELVGFELSGDADITFKSETLSTVLPFSYGRNASPFGTALKIATASGDRNVAGGISLPAGGSVTFDVRGGANTVTASLGLLSGYSGTVTFGIQAAYDDGTVKNYTSSEITAKISPSALSWVMGSGVKSITLSVNGSGNTVGVFGDLAFATTAFGEVERVADLEWSGAESGWGSVNVDRDVIGYPIEVNGVSYPHGISMHAFNDPAKYAYVQTSIPAGLGYTVFSAKIGVTKDTENNGTAGSVKFYVEGNGKRLFASNIMRVSDDAKRIVVDITGVTDLKLAVDNGDGSYDCDFAVWIDPVIARSAAELDNELILDSPIDDQAVVSSADNKFALSGTVLGKNDSVEVFVNGKKAGVAKANGMGAFATEISVDGVGKNTVKVQAGALVAEKAIYIAEPMSGADKYTLSTLSTAVEFAPANNGVIVNKLARVGGHNWIKSPSFIRFPDEIRVGGVDGRPYALDWKYVKCDYKEEDFVSKKIDVFGNDYVGKHMTYTLEYKDAGGKYVLRSVWSAYSDYKGPVSHSITILNNGDEGIFVTTADSMTATFAKPSKTDMTVSYAYKGAMYQTAYGYREDVVTSGYDMEVFSSTDYNNGYQIDAGYMPWTSLHAGSEGLNIGVVWSDCREHVYGTADGAYVKAGLRPRFKTVIPAGGEYLIPETFIDAYSGSIDNGSNQLKKWLFAFSMPEVNRLDDGLPSYGFNLWELLDQERRSWRMSDSKFYAGVHQLYEMGVDEITIDTYWWKDVGDWRGVHEKWQSSMEYSANYVHSLGMNFTIYMQAGQGGSLHSDAMTGSGIFANPDWFARGDNIFWDEVCLADPDAYEYLSAYLKNYFMEIGLDGMRTDFGYLLGYCAKTDHAHIDTRADVGYWTSVNWYKLLDEMYELFPVPTDVNDGSEVHYYKWENCNCGGTHKDFASMSRATRVQTTDAYDPLNVRRSFYDASYMFPSMQLMLWMNDYMYNPDGPFPNDNYRFWSQLLGSPCPMISMPSDMSPAMYASLVNTINIYDNWMRELVKYGDLYHILPRADGVNWDGMEYYNPDTGKGAVLAFKPDPYGTVSETVKLKFDGIDPNKNYYVWSEEGYIPFKTYKGSQLIAGLDLTIEGSYGAEIVYFMECDAEGAESITRIPDAFSANAVVRDGEVKLNVEPSANADNYVFVISKAGTPVYAFISDEEGALCNILQGLGAGSYTLEVTAYNRFGSRKTECAFEVGTSSEFFGEYKISGGDGGEAVIDGVRYVGGDTLDLTDTAFAVSRSRDVTIETDGKSELSLRLAVSDNDVANKVTLSFYGVKGGARTLIDTQTVDASERYFDFTVSVAGYDKLVVSAANSSPDVYEQSAVGYGRIGLYGGKLSTNYEFSFDVTVLRNGLNETFPRAGGFAAYVDDNNFAAIYMDAYYSNIVIYERRGTRSSDVTTEIKMPDGFDYYANHNIKVIRSGNSFRYYVDGTLIATRTLVLGASKVALITEDAQARFANVSRTVDGAKENISWSAYNTNVDIYGKTVYGTKVTTGVWKRPKLILAFVVY